MSPDHENQLKILDKLGSHHIQDGELKTKPFNSNSLERPSLDEEYFGGLKGDSSDKFEYIGKKHDPVR